MARRGGFWIHYAVMYICIHLNSRSNRKMLFMNARSKEWWWEIKEILLGNEKPLTERIQKFSKDWPTLCRSFSWPTQSVLHPRSEITFCSWAPHATLFRNSPSCLYLVSYELSRGSSEQQREYAAAASDWQREKMCMRLCELERNRASHPPTFEFSRWNMTFAIFHLSKEKKNKNQLFSFAS